MADRWKWGIQNGRCSLLPSSTTRAATSFCLLRASREVLLLLQLNFLRRFLLVLEGAAVALKKRSGRNSFFLRDIRLIMHTLFSVEGWKLYVLEISDSRSASSTTKSLSSFSNISPANSSSSYLEKNTHFYERWNLLRSRFFVPEKVACPVVAQKKVHLGESLKFIPWLTMIPNDSANIYNTRILSGFCVSANYTSIPVF